MSIKLSFNYDINEQDKVHWKNGLTSAAKTLTPDIRSIIPEIFCYSTLQDAFDHLFINRSQEMEVVYNDYVKNRVWAFAILNGFSELSADVKRDNCRRIVLCIEKKKNLGSQMPPILTFFHEVAHFVLNDIYNIKIISGYNLNEVEFLADRFALSYYLRFLNLKPKWTSFLRQESLLEFEKAMRISLKRYSVEGQRKNYLKIADIIMEKINWREVNGLKSDRLVKQMMKAYNLP